MKKMLKKSDVLREGYVKGLKKAQTIINEMLENGSGIDKFCKRISLRFKRAYKKANVKNANGYYNVDWTTLYENSPLLSLASDDYDEDYDVIKNCVYDKQKDTLTFECYSEEPLTILHFSKVFESMDDDGYRYDLGECTYKVNGWRRPKRGCLEIIYEDM